MLVSSPGPAHIVPSARDALAQAQYLQKALQETGIIYANGQSYALLNMTILGQLQR